MTESTHLKDILEAKKGPINLEVVFMDIVNYSKRKSTIQKKVIDNFTKISQEALRVISQNYVEYAQENTINFASDIIKIPTGDGLAVVFTFDGLQFIHLDFAKIILEKNHEHNIKNDCESFRGKGWCNCHDNFSLRIGISEGKGIIFKDINGNYNVAGNTINIAARVMQKGDDNTILLTEDAYKSIIDMTEDIALEENFNIFENIKVKHGVKLNIAQYSPKCDFINSQIPEDIENEITFKKVIELSPFPISFFDNEEEIDSKKMQEQLKVMLSFLSNLQNLPEPIKELKQNSGEIEE